MSQPHGKTTGAAVNQALIESQEETNKPSQLARHELRKANLYDAVAGRVGLNGFLTREQLDSSNVIPLAPEEVLLRLPKAPEKVPDDFYTAEEQLPAGNELPESDLLKAIHEYASDFYSAATHDHGQHDFRSLDETALVAMGILLEEAAREVLGENGDMVLVEAKELDSELPETRMTRHQIRGKVKPVKTPEYVSEASEEDEDVYLDVDTDVEAEDDGRWRRRRRKKRRLV